MKRISRHSLIKDLYTKLPHGAPLDLRTLERVGILPKQAARLAQTGWLNKLGQGVYSFPKDELTSNGSIKLLQLHVPGLHLAGKSALAIHGVRHNLTATNYLILWGDVRYTLPRWFISRFHARYAHTQLFDWKDSSLAEKSLGTPPGITDSVRVSAPERAVLEMLSEVGKYQSLEEARNLFDGLHNLRQDMLGRLLASCTSVKTVRLFLAWAHETKVVDLDALQSDYSLPVGSNSRWITRLKDGTLLSLKPHG